MNAEFASGPTITEEAQSDRASADDECWAMPVDIADASTKGIETKGLMRFRDGKWQLTPLGPSYPPHLDR
ncbi:hypothetical protein [Sphingomonas melonis]|uniref:Uncharacterized protein n=1 Tax=Sphingomonas melonis TaxID=152682 RepID=A0A7Y9JZV3_9SPHN|nr:hypothetical protein [Sphingomonas melonis]NYD89163.1 hypothetical protein [Sphingomonas melonis]